MRANQIVVAVVVVLAVNLVLDLVFDVPAYVRWGTAFVALLLVEVARVRYLDRRSAAEPQSS
ncbi:hypothetical protein [Aeromicrobium sp. UC242_57]|uniref:hypothetical protein n=1 Tax=Aeromicrobium sp. UC242_57 TaxID=3374624 RepID=UPI0037AF8821